MGYDRTRWQEEGVARDYERRRFDGLLARRKHANDLARLRRLLARAGEPRRVLDLPCGTGRLIGELSGEGRSVVGADLSRAMMSRSSTPPAGFLGFVQAECEHAPFRDGAFDAVVCHRFLFHVDRRETRVAILRELSRVGRVVIGQVRARATAKHRLRALRARAGLGSAVRPGFSRAELAAELREAGLELVEMQAVAPLFSDKLLFLARATRGE